MIKTFNYLFITLFYVTFVVSMTISSRLSAGACSTKPTVHKAFHQGGIIKGGSGETVGGVETIRQKLARLRLRSKENKGVNKLPFSDKKKLKQIKYGDVKALNQSMVKDMAKDMKRFRTVMKKDQADLVLQQMRQGNLKIDFNGKITSTRALPAGLEPHSLTVASRMLMPLKHKVAGSKKGADQLNYVLKELKIRTERDKLGRYIERKDRGVLKGKTEKIRVGDEIVKQEHYYLTDKAPKASLDRLQQLVSSQAPGLRFKNSKYMEIVVTADNKAKLVTSQGSFTLPPNTVTRLLLGK
ncbi:MAG: hypothetical protein HN730_11800 [Bdellovibrionales bacterium]|nr:hypothetical protein [Bdellovibrionales bacterium]